MIDCIILGDSIAVGLATIRGECVSHSRGGWNTWQWNRDYLKTVSGNVTKHLIISLGSNDHQYIKTENELRKLRGSVTADKVSWILPAGNLAASKVDIKHIQSIIYAIAKEYGDIVIPISSVSVDKIHPSGAGYKQLAVETRKK